MASKEQDDQPSRYFDGWYAVPPGELRPVNEPDDEEPYDGQTLRIMFDEDAGPLWGDEGLLENTPGWMDRELGLSASLIDDLHAWLRDTSVLHHRRSTADWQERTDELDRRGHRLADRLRDEVGDRYRVWFHA